ncbi:7671_t:CDS:1, partial [Acaulospora morrowiae]
SNLNEDELENAIHEITTAITEENDIFEFIKEKDSLENENLDSDIENNDNLLIAEIINLDILNFKENEKDIVLDSKVQSKSTKNHGDHNVDFEAILNEELGK